MSSESMAPPAGHPVGLPAGQHPGDRAAPATERPGLVARLWLRLKRRLVQRWPVIRRTLPRDALILLWLAILLQFVGIAWVATDSVHTSMALVLKGVRAQPGELVVFGYSGGQIERYFPETAISRLQRSLGMQVRLDGPRPNEGFIKYLIGVQGDRIEVEGDHVFLSTRRGRLDMGRCKPATRNGVPLTPIAPQVIPPGYVYVWAPHVDALDSRYAVMGLVPVHTMVGKAVRLW